MVEEPHAGEAHGDAVLVGRLDHVVVADGAAGLGNIFHAAAESALNVVSEGEESVGTEGHTGVACQPFLLLFRGQNSGLLGEKCLLLAVIKDIHVFLAHIEIDRVVAVSAAHILFEGEIQYLGALAQIPVVSLLAGNTGVTLGSAAFFPFGDNIERAFRSGVKYVAQPGGSIRDDNVIEACDKFGMVMAFTGMRLFHH